MHRTLAAVGGAQTTDQLDDAIDQCVSAKNQMYMIEGYSPSQWVLAQNPRVPDSVLEENPDINLWNADQKGMDFQRHMEVRQAARQAFLRSDVSARLRRERRDSHPDIPSSRSATGSSTGARVRVFTLPPALGMVPESSWARMVEIGGWCMAVEC